MRKLHHALTSLRTHRCVHLRTLAAAALGYALAACAGGDSIAAPGSVTGDPTEKKAPVVATNPLAGLRFYVDPYSNAKRQADAWRSTRPGDAAQIDKIATRPQANWFNEWVGNIASAILGVKTEAAKQSAVPVLVAYNIPDRDCGGLSGGGGATPDAYRTWITSFAAAVGTSRAVVVLEPDALAGMSCLSDTQQETRFDLLRYAVQALKAQPNVTVYLDAGHPAWQPAPEMARRLMRAGIAQADGFALNVSNFIATALNVSYGLEISSAVGGKRFIIDTSRNGLGATADYQWCNPPGRALGTPATTTTAHPSVDAYLWIKRPGESDGACNGAPNAGAWWPEYALDMAQRS